MTGWRVDMALLTKQEIEELLWLIERPEAKALTAFLKRTQKAVDRKNRHVGLPDAEANALRGESRNIHRLLRLREELLKAHKQTAETAGEVVEE